MTQQMLQVSDDLSTRDILGMEADIKSETLAGRRYSKASDDRYFIASITVAQDRCATDRGPGSTDAWDEQEAAFVEERQMGTKLSGFFLYAAMFGSSIGQWLFRLFGAPAVLVSGNSSRGCGVTVSTPRLSCTGSRNRTESIAQYVLASIVRWSIRLPLLLAATVSSAFLSGELPTEEAVPIVPGSEPPSGLSFDRFGANALRNSKRSSISLLRFGKFALNATWQWLAAAAFLTDRDFHGVSCHTE